MTLLWFVLITIIYNINCASATASDRASANDNKLMVIDFVYTTMEQDCKRKVGVSKPSHCSVLDDKMRYSNSTPTNCMEILNRGIKISGIYTVRPDRNHAPFRVYCDMHTNGGGYMEIQKRTDASVDFYQDWSHYKHGFGDLLTEFWIGLRYIQRITGTSQTYELLVEIKDRMDNIASFTYRAFKIDVEANGYKLISLGKFKGGDAKLDSLRDHLNMKCTTKDVDQDQSNKTNCAEVWKGAWWYNKCFKSNLNGKYLNVPIMGSKSAVWANAFGGGYYVLKGTRMLLRPV